VEREHDASAAICITSSAAASEQSAGLHCLSKASMVCLTASLSSSLVSTPSSFAEKLASMATKRQITDARLPAKDQEVGIEIDDKHALKRRLSWTVQGEPGWLNIS